MHQRSLFPEAFEVEDAALEALEELDVERARRQLVAARAADPGLAGLDRIEEALDWLASNAGGAAERFLELAPAVARGALSPGARRLIEPVLARYALAHAPPEALFLDAEERVHRGALLLALAHSRAAEAVLARSLEGVGERRGELWGYRGDALVAMQRPDEANACYLRALLLSPERFDLERCRDARLAALFAELGAEHGEALARELAFAHAWLRAFVALTGPDPVVDRALPGLRARAAADANSPELRARRFALLLYEDRTGSARQLDLERREAMQELDPELFRAVLARCRALERR